ncbi:hypothetical protein [Owenweeksia hongkongensis]|uniref:Uncharacterized protein n=1 Tax=Owenweeksia hongkongensis (strain DSM 17368 / CIP 108786 / JCM 12287 / NRRL B-23963 / UST20020801) TaxID=926562 RepID=G8R6K9_OWEHD|nr:hypothetical protein [Owenweeksia hongkongensis]AEV31152.1 hypothetical protein Oweho_0130 [Owenweeksia hongkongensis DSM 17368]
MDSADRLIEYYFQRKIAGMPSSDIHQSLKQQMMEEEERDVIVSQVEYKESLYLKALSRKKIAKILAIVGIALILITASVFFYTYTSDNIFINPAIIYSVFGVGVALALSSFFLYPKGNIASFKS